MNPSERRREYHFSVFGATPFMAFWVIGQLLAGQHAYERGWHVLGVVIYGLFGWFSLLGTAAVGLLR